MMRIKTKSKAINYEVGIASDNDLCPVRLTIDVGPDRVVELFLTPAQADQLGRKIITIASKALETWKAVS